MNENMLFEAINEIDDDLIINSNKKNKSNVFKWVSVAAVFALAIIGAVSFFNADNAKQVSPDIPLNEFPYVDNETGRNSIYSYFYTELCIEKNIYYTQVQKNEYEKYAIKNQLSQDDFGEYLGEVTFMNRAEIMNYDTFADSYAVTDNILLKNAKIYLYKPKNCNAMLIVKSGDYCSLYRAMALFNDDFEDESYFSKLFNLYSVKSISDIEKITYGYFSNEFIENGAGKIKDKITEAGVITDKGDIEKIYNVLVTEDVEYDDPSELLVSKYIVIRFHLKNGLIIGEDNNLQYYPNEDKGYMLVKGLLNKEQNEILKSLLIIE